MLSGLTLGNPDLMTLLITKIVAILSHNWFYNLFIILNFLLQLRILRLQADIFSFELVGQFLLGIHFFEHIFIVVGLFCVNLGPCWLGLMLIYFSNPAPWHHLSFILSCKLLSKILYKLTIRILVSLKLVADFQIDRRSILFQVQVAPRFRSLSR